MMEDKQETSEPVSWVKRVNRAWIVRGGLGSDADAYIEHLAREDPDRLARSCQNARGMIDARDPTDDPKPWFYAGLFSLATIDETKRFLANHWFTIEAIPTLADALGSPRTLGEAGEETKAKLARIRRALAPFLVDPG